MLKRFHLDELFGKQDGDCVFNSTELEVFVLHPSIKTLRRPESPSQLTCTLDRPGHQKLLKDLYVMRASNIHGSGTVKYCQVPYCDICFCKLKDDMTQRIALAESIPCSFALGKS